MPIMPICSITVGSIYTNNSVNMCAGKVNTGREMQILQRGSKPALDLTSQNGCSGGVGNFGNDTSTSFCSTVDGKFRVFNKINLPKDKDQLKPVCAVACEGNGVQCFPFEGISNSGEGLSEVQFASVISLAEPEFNEPVTKQPSPLTNL